jgi:hypothetical protein
LPPDTVRGLFFLARAASLVERSRQKQIVRYGRTEYVKYHGSEPGWGELVKLAKSSPAMPAGFVIDGKKMSEQVERRIFSLQFPRPTYQLSNERED